MDFLVSFKENKAFDYIITFKAKDIEIVVPFNKIHDRTMATEFIISLEQKNITGPWALICHQDKVYFTFSNDGVSKLDILSGGALMQLTISYATQIRLKHVLEAIFNQSS